MALPQFRIYDFARTLTGIALCAIAAVLVAAFSAGRPGKFAIPVFFIAVLIAVALRFGIAACVGGALVATLIFAHMLYQPVGSFVVASEAARTNLGWMLLGSIVPAYLLVPKRGPNDEAEDEHDSTHSAAGH